MSTQRSFSELLYRWLTFLCIVITELLYGLLEIKASKGYGGYAGYFFVGNGLFYLLFILLIFFWYPELRKKDNWTFVLFTFLIFGLYVYCDLMATMYFALNVIAITILQAIAALLFLVCLNVHSEIKIRIGKSFLFFLLAFGIYFYFVNDKFSDHDKERPYALAFCMKILSGIWWQTCVLLIIESVYSLNLNTYRKVQSIAKAE